MLSVTVRISGVSPLMMHSGLLVNPLNPIVIQMKEITNKKEKTEDDYMHLYRLEFLGGLYYDSDIGPYIPGSCIWSTIRNGARMQKKGPAIERGLIMPHPMNRLDYTGLRKASELFDAGFADIRNAKPPGARGQVMRCRPIFQPPWGVTFSLTFDPAYIASNDLRSWTQLAGEVVGLCDGRKIGMGRYTVERWDAR